MIYLILVAILAVAGYWIYLDSKAQQRLQRWLRRQANLTIYRERRDDLATGHDSEDAPFVEEMEKEADLVLLDDIEDQSEASVEESKTKWLPHATIGALCIFSIVAYVFWGDPLAIRLESVPSRFENAESAEDLDKIVNLLQARNSSRHQGFSSATYLIHTYFLQGDYESVVREHKLAEERGTNTLTSDIERVRASFELNDRTISDEDRVVVDRILSSEPDHPTILQLLAFDAYARSQFASARDYLERVLRQPLAPGVATLLGRLLGVTNDNLGEDHVGIEVNVVVRNIQTPHQWLTVFARTDSTSAPVAVVRRPNVETGTHTFLLDDIVSMMPNQKLSTLDRVTVVARLSPSANVTDTAQASQIESGWISPSPTASVSLEISEIVAENSVAVTVGLDPNLEAPENWPVFIIAREPNVPGPPLLVKRVSVADLPISVLLSPDDAMLPGKDLLEEELEIFARVSSTGSASREVNDLESPRVLARAGQSIGLKIDSVVEEPAEQ